MENSLYNQKNNGIILLFVYGSLKTGQHNHGQMRGKFLQQVRTMPCFRLISFGTFPGLISGTKSIEGELWEVTEEDLIALDAFESDIYSRELIPIENNIEAYAYLVKDTMFLLNTDLIEETNWVGLESNATVIN